MGIMLGGCIFIRKGMCLVLNQVPLLFYVGFYIYACSRWYGGHGEITSVGRYAWSRKMKLITLECSDWFLDGECCVLAVTNWGLLRFIISTLLQRTKIRMVISVACVKKLLNFDTKSGACSETPNHHPGKQLLAFSTGVYQK